MIKSTAVRALALAIGLGTTLFANAQTGAEKRTSGSESLPDPLMENLKFRNIGPAGMSGRVTAIDADPVHPEVIYVGSASGGLWKSSNAGQSWNSIWDDQPNASIGAVKVDPSNPDVIWVGTGEGNPRNSQSIGDGLFRSLDGGRTWQRMGLEKTKGIHRIVVDPRNSNNVYVAAIGLAYGDTEDRGVYRTQDGGKTWKKVLYTNNRSGAADLILDPQNPNKLFAAMWEYRRWPWVFKSGGPGSGLYVTHDGGDTWVKRTDKDGLPAGDLGRMGLAVSRTHPNVVYALVENKEKNALYRSQDGGVKWTRISDEEEIGNRPFYYSEIYVDPFRENTVYSLWTLVTKSEDGGRTWKTIAPYNNIHPDHHAFWASPTVPGYLIEGNDGGLNISHDGGNTWRFVENLPLAQFYHIRVDNALPYNVYGGMQDNGSWKGPAYTFKDAGIGNTEWQELYFGDGFDVVPHPTDPHTAYAMAQEGYLGRVNTQTGQADFIKPVHPEGQKLRFHWNAAIAQDPFQADALYYGSQYVHFSTDRGQSWQIISPDLTTNNPDKQKALESGGLTWDVTGAENHTCLLAIAPSSLERGLVWTGSDDGQIHITRDGGKTWTLCTPRIKGMPAGAWVPHLHAGTHQAGEAWAVVNNYRQNDFTPYLFYTSDYGKTWKNLTPTGCGITGHTLSVVQDNEVDNLLYLGTETGLYVSANKGQSWQRWKGLPTMPVQDLALQTREKDLILGTFGRAAWILDDLEPLRAWVRQKGAPAQRKLTAFTAPTAYHAIYAESDGIRFQGDAMFKGQNRSRGARLSLYVVRDTADKALKKEKFLRATVYASNGTAVRKMARRVPEETGLMRWNWELRSAGVESPSLEKREREDGSDPWGGPMVEPGTYKIVFTYGSHKDSTTVRVEDDPRVSSTAADWAAYTAFQKSVMAQTQRLTTAVDQLRLAKEQMARMETLLGASLDTAATKGLKKSVKAVKDSLEVRRLDLFGKENQKGYYEQPDTWSSQSGTMGGYVWSLRGAPSANTLNQFKLYQDQTERRVRSINEFIETDWAPLAKQWNEASVTWLKALEPVK